MNFINPRTQNMDEEKDDVGRSDVYFVRLKRKCVGLSTAFRLLQDNLEEGRSLAACCFHFAWNNTLVITEMRIDRWGDLTLFHGLAHLLVEENLEDVYKNADCIAEDLGREPPEVHVAC